MHSRDTASARYAVYFAPDEATPLAEFGEEVLSLSPLTDDHPIRLSVIEKAAYYGFHATLKAPMSLAPGISEDDLLSAVETLMKNKQPIEMTGLAPRTVRGFHALTLPSCPEVDELAQQTVTDLDAFRAPMSQAERARRQPEKLTQSQRFNLDTYGYPFVAQDFEFHMTLSCHMDPGRDSSSYGEWLTARFTDLVTDTPTLDRVAIFWQPDRDTPFTRIHDVLAGH